MRLKIVLMKLTVALLVVQLAALTLAESNVTSKDLQQSYKQGLSSWKHEALMQDPDKDQDKDEKDPDDDDDDDDDRELPQSRCVERIWKQKDACQFLKSLECTGVGVGSLANYAQNYVCSPIVVRLVQIPVLYFYVLNLFAVASTIASEFFGASFRGLLTRAGLSAATVTAFFLAVGNGSFEIFAAIGAIRTGQTNLALSELVSSAFFATTLGVGMIAYMQPFKYVRRGFLRDVAFFIIATLFTIVILSDDDIKLFEASGFLGLYAAYIFMVTVGANFVGRDHPDYESVDAVDPFDSQLADDPMDPSGLNVWEQEQATRRRPLHGPPRLVQSVQSTMESILPTENLRDGALQQSVDEEGGGIMASSRSTYGATDNNDRTAQIISNQIGRGQIRSVWASYAVHEAAERSETLGKPDLEGAASSHEPTAYEWLFPTLSASIAERNQRQFWEQFVSIAIAPAVFLVRLTVPIAYEPGRDSKHMSNAPSGLVHNVPQDSGRLPGDDFEAGYSSYHESVPSSVLFDSSATEPMLAQSDPAIQAASSLSSSSRKQGASRKSAGPTILPPRNLFLIQNFFAGFLLAMFFMDVTSLSSFLYTTFVWLICIIVGIVSMAVTISILDSGATVAGFYQYVSFCVSIAWGYILAKEIVAVLATLGMAFGVTSTMMGITVFACLCNLGEVMTNISLVRHGFASIAVRASFAGPMLNLLFGFGLSTVWVLLFMGPVSKLKKPPGEKSGNPGLFSSLSQYVHILDDGAEIKLETSSSVLFLCYALMGALLFSIYYVPTNNFHATKKYGLILVAWWLVSMFMAVMIELIVKR